MLCFKVFEVFLIGRKLRRLLVLSQFRVILLLCSVGLPLAAFPFVCWQHLPFLTNHLCNLGERKVLALEGFPHFCRHISYDRKT
jgi:hypothetical protein